jgi:hypothetical protein
LKVAGGKSGEVVEADVIRGVAYMWAQLKRVAQSKPKKDRRISFTSRKTSASADPLNGLPVVLVVSADGIRTVDNISRHDALGLPRKLFSRMLSNLTLLSLQL